MSPFPAMVSQLAGRRATRSGRPNARWSLRSFPRYEATTAGWRTTSAGSPSAMTRRGRGRSSGRRSRSAAAGRARSRAAWRRACRGCAQQRSERLGLALGDPARRLVEQQHGRARGRARTRGRRSGGFRSTARGRTCRGTRRGRQVDELLDALADAASDVVTVGRCSAADSRVCGPRRASRARPRWSRATVSAGEQAAVLERAAEAELGAGLRATWRQVVAAVGRVSRRIVPPSAGRKPEMTSNSVVLPAPLGPMKPRISPGAR